MRLLLFGCTGFVGRELLPQLLQAGHQLTVVSRRLARGYAPERADGRLIWMQFDPVSSSTWADAGLLDALNQADAVVNLAGEPIAEQRWTPSHRQLLETSRLETTSQLVKSIEACSTTTKDKKIHKKKTNRTVKAAFDTMKQKKILIKINK